MDAPTVFDVFPAEIGRWVLCRREQDTLNGLEYTDVTELVTITEDLKQIDPSSAVWSSTTSQLITLPDNGALVYIYPVPNLDPMDLVENYALKEQDRYWAIKSVYVGKNQDTGEVEHWEVLLNGESI